MEKIIIYGYSSIGEAVYQECMRRKLSILCFCEDTKVQKSEVYAKLDLFSFDEIVNRKLDGKFIICIPNARPVIKKLEDAGYSNWTLVNEYLSEEHYFHDTFTIKSREIAIKEIEECILCHQYLKMSDKIFLKSIDLEITEKCSMRCRDCSNLMQYYKNPKNYSARELIDSIDTLLKYIDVIYEIRVLGGEPFMHSEIHRIIERLISYQNVYRIVIYTNATIMPTEEMWDVFENEKVEFEMTDYGKLSRNFFNIEQELDKRKIVYEIIEMKGWTQCSSIIKHGRGQEEVEKIYKECCAKNLVTLLDGKIYKCPYMANAMNLKAIPTVEGEFIDLNQLENMRRETAKQKLRGYLFSKEYFTSCDYCEGRPYSGEEIKPAVQISEPRNYSVVGEERD